VPTTPDWYALVVVAARPVRPTDKVSQIDPDSCRSSRTQTTEETTGVVPRSTMVWGDVFHQPTVALGATAGILLIDVEGALVARRPAVALVGRLPGISRFGRHDVSMTV
jgi:hypothetical protein